MSKIKNNNNGVESKMKNKKITDRERMNMVWDYMEELDFNGDFKLDVVDGGFDIEFTWKDWSKK